MHPKRQRVVIIGDYPSAASEGRVHYGCKSGPMRHLVQLSGLSRERFLQLFEVKYLINEPVQKWPKANARAVAAAVDLKGRRAILCGERVAEAFGLHMKTCPLFEWFPLHNGEAALVPHPSIHNRYWIKPENVRRTQQFFRELIVWLEKIEDWRVTPDEVEEMWRAYLEVQSIEHVMRATGHSRAVVTRYIREGDPERGIEPFTARLRRIISMAQQMEDIEVARVRAALQTSARAVANILSQRIKQVIENPDEIREIPPDELPGLLDRTARLLMWLYGEPERSVSVEMPPPSPERLAELIQMLRPDVRERIAGILSALPVPRDAEVSTDEAPSNNHTTN